MSWRQHCIWVLSLAAVIFSLYCSFYIWYSRQSPMELELPRSIPQLARIGKLTMDPVPDPVDPPSDPDPEPEDKPEPEASREEDKPGPDPEEEAEPEAPSPDPEGEGESPPDRVGGADEEPDEEEGEQPDTDTPRRTVRTLDATEAELLGEILLILQIFEQVLYMALAVLAVWFIFRAVWPLFRG